MLRNKVFRGRVELGRAIVISKVFCPLRINFHLIEGSIAHVKNT